MPRRNRNAKSGDRNKAGRGPGAKNRGRNQRSAPLSPLHTHPAKRRR